MEGVITEKYNDPLKSVYVHVVHKENGETQSPLYFCGHWCVGSSFLLEGLNFVVHCCFDKDCMKKRESASDNPERCCG